MGWRIPHLTVPVPRHELPNGLGGRAEELDKSTVANVEWLESPPAGFRLAFGTALLAAFTHCGEDPRAADLPTWEAWVTATQVGSALFATSTATTGTVKCRITDQVRTIRATGPQFHSNAENWLNAFWLTIACGEQERMTALAQVPLEVLRASGADYDEYIYSWISALQTWWLRGGDLGGLLSAAFDGTDPEELEDGDRDLVLRIIYPPMNLFLRYITGDHVRFNEALADALRRHKEYWTRVDGGTNTGNCSSFVALGPLAMACLARDAGFPLTVESEYLPKHLVARSWVGEFDTIST
ncbi:immunity 49 family protein [Streptomyces sp. NPDC004126]|uniref:immunity 49 family protein n=1 Tax=Streptomyces sp. NPDC004126 TaxID=3390695 RepID=UPI003D056EF4